MITPLMVEFASQAPTHLYGTNTRTAYKFTAASENARKTYLRTLYGFQPAKGTFSGFIRYAKVTGTVVAIEIYFIWSVHNPVGVFELPLHAFKQDGHAIKCSSDVENFVGRYVDVVAAGRYKFNGISLSIVTSIEMDSTIQPVPTVLKRPDATQE